MSSAMTSVTAPPPCSPARKTRTATASSSLPPTTRSPFLPSMPSPSQPWTEATPSRLLPATSTARPTPAASPTASSLKRLPLPPPSHGQAATPSSPPQPAPFSVTTTVLTTTIPPETIAGSVSTSRQAPCRLPLLCTSSLRAQPPLIPLIPLILLSIRSILPLIPLRVMSSLCPPS